MDLLILSISAYSFPSSHLTLEMHFSFNHFVFFDIFENVKSMKV